MNRKTRNKSLIYLPLLVAIVILLTVAGKKSSSEVIRISGDSNLFGIAFGLSLFNDVIATSEDRSKEEFCKDVNDKFLKFRWHNVICKPDRWKVFSYSSRGNPLFYQEFGFDDPDNKGPVNLLLCGVHGDEPPAVYLCFRMVRDILFDSPETLKNFKVIIAPIVNPDGFFANTRHNANGVDPNRNLPTKDWEDSARKVWANYNNDPRKFPGETSGSEEESKFQTYLINKYKPDKIISVHAPLGFLDFDGPGDQKYYDLVRVEHRAKYLGLNIEANSKRLLKLTDFRFFPGSLGNYAGNERKIPTYTAELPNSDASKAYYFWDSLRFAFIKALNFEIYDEREKHPLHNAQAVSERVKDKGLELAFYFRNSLEKVKMETAKADAGPDITRN